MPAANVRDPYVCDIDAADAADVGARGAWIVIPRVSAIDDPAALVMSFKSARLGFDRVRIDVGKIAPVGAAMTYPVEIEWQLIIGGVCLADRARVIATDTTTLTSDAVVRLRTGSILYHVGGLLLNHVGLRARVASGGGSAEFAANFYWAADKCGGVAILDGGGLPPVYRGGVIDP